MDMSGREKKSVIVGSVLKKLPINRDIIVILNINTILFNRLGSVNVFVF